MKLQLTQHIAKKIVTLQFPDLSEGHIRSLKKLMLDSLAVTIAGMQTKEIKTLIDIDPSAYSEKAPCSLIGNPKKSSIFITSFVNAAAMHILDFEPMWNPPTHICSPVLSPILALAEERKFSGKEVLVAFAVALEVYGRTLCAFNNFAVPVTFHPPGYIGPLGSAAGCGKLLGLDETKMEFCLGFAVSRTGGLMVNAGTEAKCLHSGSAAQSGLESALFAAAGFKSAKNALEHDLGYFASFAKKPVDYTTFDSFMNPFWIEKQPFATKMHPCQFMTNSAADAAIALQKQEGFNPSEISSIVLHFPHASYIDRPVVKTTFDGKFSLQFITAAGLLFGDVFIETFSEEVIHDPKILEIMEKISLEFDEKNDPIFDQIDGELRVVLKNKKTFIQACVNPLGHWKNPVSEEKFLEKVRRCLHTQFSEAKTEQIIESIYSFETLNNIQSFMRILS